MTTAFELDHLRRELLHRFKAHPPGTWPEPLLRAVIDIVDLGFGAPEPASQVKLRLVSSTDRQVTR